MRVSDLAGNRVSLDAQQLEDAEFDAAFDVSEGPDTEGPQLTGYTLTPSSLDTNAAAGSVRFSIEATDDLSGVEDAAVLIRQPDAGTALDGVWRFDRLLPPLRRQHDAAA